MSAVPLISWILGGLLLPAVAMAGEAEFAAGIRPLMKEYCISCHSAEKHKGDLDLERFETLDAAMREPKVWQQVVEQIESGEMPPEKKRQPSAEQRQQLLDWAKGSLLEWARAHAGDPGPVVLRRLSNAEYTWSLRDLTGVEALDPAREFPVDGAAGEGFTNAGAALGMSPALVGKYLEAAKEVAGHAVLLPDGIAFSPSTTRRDWTEEKLAAIRGIYSRYTVPGEGMALNLQGLRFDTLDGGVLPLENYFAATLEKPSALSAGKFAEVARERNLQAKYLQILWETLNSREASYPLEGIRELWRNAKPADGPFLAEAVKGWQRSLWRFHAIGQIGKRKGPRSWQEAVTPIATERELRLKLPARAEGDMVLSLVTSDARDGNAGDVIRWETPRLLRGKLPPIPLQQAELLGKRLDDLLEKELPRTSAYLEALAAVRHDGTVLADIAAVRDLNPELLANWSALTNIGHSKAPAIRGHFTGKLAGIGGFPFVRGWGSPQTPSMTVNGSQEVVRFSTLTVPGRSVLLHPSPDKKASIIWCSPVAGKIRVSGQVADADGNCGNGVAWRVDQVTRAGRRDVAAGVIQNGGRETFDSPEEFAVEAGDLIAFEVDPRDGEHVCDTTQVALTIADSLSAASWDLAAEVIDRIHESNPLPDAAGHPDVWHFCALPLNDDTSASHLPATVLALWQEAVLTGKQRSEVDAAAKYVQDLLVGKLAPAWSNERLRDMLLDIEGPLEWGTIAFKGAGGEDIPATGPSRLDFRIPAKLASGAEFVVKARLERGASDQGSVVADVILTDASGVRRASGEMPVLASAAGAIRAAEGFEAFHSIFPAALCYTKIVPVDEVVTLRLFYREDEMLRRLVLDDGEIADLERLWRELNFVSLAPLRLVDAFEQLWQYATQDGDPTEFDPLRQPIATAAEGFERDRIAAEPLQLESLVEFAGRAWRRPLGDAEKESLRSLYRKLRSEELDHEEAIRLTLTRVLTAPAFLYKLETPGPAQDAVPVNDYELATRLAYFLWSSVPDEELLTLASQGKLRDPAVLAEQARRMTADPRVRRLAIEFGTQWLHVRGLDQLDEKSESVFPEFAGIRGDLNEEPVRFFTDLFQHDGRVSDLLDADHTFVNAALANYYGIEGVEGSEWRRVEGVRKRGRGGILGFGATLAKQSGASRTSPILRGTWVCETILGEHLPSPPKDVPVLPEQPPAGLSERALTELHTKDPACARCHAKIDPYGFALEHYDAIGRFRTMDLVGQPVQDAAKLPDGKEIAGMGGLRDYLLRDRGDDFTRQFCRKLLGYALGRGVLLSDEPLLDEMQAELAAGGQRVGIAIGKVVRSPQFREIRGKDRPVTE
ncbi:DUF1592 domain-containing protein [Luteolibacter sp. Populi]|uniref:DUF1592 domain-containing protein n=1 Tax=Luteolibacter sp. Populi TaxID=3230487 RepID=UPI003466352E